MTDLETELSGLIFDVSEANGGEPFDTLSDALTYANNVLLESQKKGGMTIKYVQSSDNKYVQARCMAQNFTTDVTQWQGVDSEITGGSHNMVESGAVYASQHIYTEAASVDYEQIERNSGYQNLSLEAGKTYKIRLRVVMVNDKQLNYIGLYRSRSGTAVEVDLNELYDVVSYPDGFDKEAVFTLENDVLYILSTSDTSYQYAEGNHIYVDVYEVAEKYDDCLQLNDRQVLSDAEKENVLNKLGGVDNQPTKDSEALVRSGGVYNVFHSLDVEVNGESSYVPKTLDLIPNAYYACYNTYTQMRMTTTERQNTYCCMISCNAGDKFKVYGRGAGAVKLYAFTNGTDDRTILLANKSTVDCRADGLELTAPNGSAYLYIDFNEYDSTQDKLEVYVSGNGLTHRVDELEQNTVVGSDIVNDLTTGGADKVLSAEQGKVLNTKMEGEAGYVIKELELIENNYYAIISGGTYMSDVYSAKTGTQCARIECSAGDKFKVYGYGKNAIKLYAFTKNTREILETTDTGDTNTRADGLEITAPEGTYYLYINFMNYDVSTDKLEKYEATAGLEGRIKRLEDTKVYSGKKIIVFGDSITEFKWETSMGGDGKGWVDHAAEVIGCEFVNAAIGGAHMNVRTRVEVFDETNEYAVDDYVYRRKSEDNKMHIYKCISAHTGTWADADFEDKSGDTSIIGGVAYYPLWVWSMIKAFCDIETSDPYERFKNQIAAAECVYTWKASHDDNRAIVQRLVDTDPNDIDAVVILHGANDYATYGYWGTSGSFDTTTLLGAINACVKELNSVFKSKPVYYVTPPVRWFNYTNGTGEQQDFSDYYVREGSSKSYKQFVYEILANEYKLNHVPVCDIYGELQWTMWNFSNYFPSNDGTHPRPGFKNIGQKIASFLTANKVIV